MKKELDAYVALMRARDEHDRNDPEWSRLDDEAMARWRALQRPLPRPRSVAGLERLIRGELDCHPADDVDALLARCRRGSGRAAGELVSLAPNRLRGHVVAWAYKAGLRQRVLRQALFRAWNHDHDWALQAAGSYRTLERWFKAAAFELPPGLPDPLTLWRGTTGVPLWKAAGGVSWTTRPGVAAWFACEYCLRRRGDPLVIRRVVPLKDVLLYTDDRNEAEAVVLRPAPAEVVGDEAWWRQLAEAEEARRRGRGLAAADDPDGPGPAAARQVPPQAAAGV